MRRVDRPCARSREKKTSESTPQAKYVRKTPPDPGRGLFAWLPQILRLWTDEDFLEYAGLDGLVMIRFLRFCADQAFFATVVGCCVLLPAYYSGGALLENCGTDDDDTPCFDDDPRGGGAAVCVAVV